MGILIGVIVIQQIYLHRKIKVITQPDETSALGFQISQLIKTNDKLQTEIFQLNQEKEKMVQVVEERWTASENISETKTKYSIIAGTSFVEGKGVKISVADKLEMVQIVDLINALRNIGAEAISINNKRIGLRTGISSNFFEAPYKILIIGDPAVLYNALTRPGGIIAQIDEEMQVEKVNSIIISPLEK